jgi:hypothetical protein
MAEIADTIIALKGADKFWALQDLYRDCLEEHVRPFPIAERQGDACRSRRLSHYKTLCCLSVLPALSLIWKESRFIQTVAGGAASDLARRGLTAAELGMLQWSSDAERRLRAVQRTGSAALRDERLCAEGREPASRQGEAARSRRKYIVRAQRLAEAAHTFGLIEKIRVRRNLIVLRGTERLHNLMRRTFSLSGELAS